MQVHYCIVLADCSTVQQIHSQKDILERLDIETYSDNICIIITALAKGLPESDMNQVAAEPDIDSCSAAIIDQLEQHAPHLC